METFSSISTELDKAIKNVLEKKKALDDATATVTAANSNYLVAMNKAKDLRDTMTQCLNEALMEGNTGARVRN